MNSRGCLGCSVGVGGQVAPWLVRERAQMYHQSMYTVYVLLYTGFIVCCRHRHVYKLMCEVVICTVVCCVFALC